MSERDELTMVHEVLWGLRVPKGGGNEYIRLDANAAHAIAAAILAAGYRKVES